MRKRNILMLLTLTTAMTAMGAKITGTTTLKDLQPTGQTDKKNNKHQQYDLSFDAQNMKYTCRTSSKKSTNASNFVVGGDLRYEVDGQKVKLKTANGKQVECTVVRVEAESKTEP
jgi:hypothetical protein